MHKYYTVVGPLNTPAYEKNFQYCEGIFSEITQSPDRFLAKKSENCIILNGAVQTVLKKIYI